MKRSVVPTIIILGLALSLAGPIRAVQAINQIFIADFDQDGISDSMETNGWYNLVGGPYVTSPDQADSDHDGLTDAEEKLFNFIPTDPASPGISVPYESAFKTFQYYNKTDPAYLAMVQGGNRYLLTEALVVRRGTTFKVAAVNTGAASLTITGAGLTALSPTPDPARGGWKVSVPTNGTVGTYTATITNGAWSKSMNIYVIFELPTDMTQAQINAYLYDDDPANKRDEVAVWWRARDWKFYNADSEVFTACPSSEPICSEWQYHTNTGYAQAFWTEQFTKKVLVTYTLPAIQGKTTPYTAADAIDEKADAAVRLNYYSVKNSFSSATAVIPVGNTFKSAGGACETSAGVFTAMLRSAGIASRPFALDYNKTAGHGEQGNFGIFEYDHAVMLWVKSSTVASNRWYANRTFSSEEAEFQSTPEWVSGSTGMRLLSEVGIYNPAPPQSEFNNFQDIHADLIQSANEGWDFQVGSLGGGMVNTMWTGIDVHPDEFTNYVQNRDFKWNSKRPLEILQSPYVDILNCQLWKGDGWAPSEWYEQSSPFYSSNPIGRNARGTYGLPSVPSIIPSAPGDIENWPYNPKPTNCSFSTSPAACAAFQATWQASCSPLPSQTLGNVAQQPQQSSPSITALNTSIQLGNILSDSGVDLDGDGRFDQLVVTFELTSSQAGEYQLGGWLRAGDELIRTDKSQVSLTTGLQTAQITFDGQQIGDNNFNGPYQVEAIWIAPMDKPVSELALPEEMAAYQTYSYTSQPYLSSAFSVRAASITGNYSYTGTDTNQNGLFDSVTISVPLEIALPGAFMVEADLYAGNGDFVGHAEWTGSDPVAYLEFAVAGTVPPYSLEHLNLFEAGGESLAAFYAPVFTMDDLGGKVDQANIVPGSSTSVISPQTVTPTNTFTATPVDLNANGRYDKLVVSAGVNVAVQGGSYWMEGLLVDSRNIPVSWSVSAPQILTVGVNQTLQMDFDARMLFDHLPLTGSRAFTLVGVKIFSGTPGQAILEASIPVTGLSTAAYSRAQVEPSIPASIRFQDDMESGAGKWVVDGSTQWSLATNTWHSWTSAWMAVGSTTKSGLLTLAAPLDLRNNSNPWLRFNSAYRLPGTTSVKLEVSTNGTTWTTVKTYSGSTDYWSPQLVDLSAYKNTSGVKIRFNAQANSGVLWYVDDVFVMNLEPIRHIYLPFVTR